MPRRPSDLNLGNGLKLPPGLVGARTSIIGQPGTGKTSTAVVVVEEADRIGARFAIVDPTGAWYGLASNGAGDGPGLDCVVMGGQHGDVPLDQAAGRLCAELVADQAYNLVLDLDGLPSWAARQRFVADFAAELYERAHSQILVVIDEAHRFAPQGGSADAAKVLGAVSDLVLLGRRRGIGSITITQRPARLNKDVLEAAEVLISHRVRGNNDRKALGGWIEEHDKDVKAMLQEIAGLENGRARVSAPTFDVDGVFAIRPKETFDSSATPEIGGVSITPTARAEVDMDALRVRMAATIEKAKADDPRELHATIRRLEARLVEQAPSDELEAARARIRELEHDLEESSRKVVDRERVIQTVRDAVGSGTGTSPVATSRAVEQLVPSRPPARPTPARPTPAPTQQVDRDGDGLELKAGARRILEALARHHPMSFTRAQVGTLTGFKVSGGTFQTYWSTLRRAGYIDENNGTATVTAAGLDRAGVVPESPATTDEMVAMWASRLKRGARDMLELLVARYPQAVTRDQLAAELDMAASGGTFQTYLSTLRRNGLADVDGGTVTASSTLFISGGAT